MKQIMYVVIEIESNNTHSTRNIEQALNFFWGSNGKFTVRDAVEHSVQRTGLDAVACKVCGKPVDYHGHHDLAVIDGTPTITAAYCEEHWRQLGERNPPRRLCKPFDSP